MLQERTTAAVGGERGGASRAINIVMVVIIVMMLLTTSNLDANGSGHPKRGVIGIRLGSRSIERVGSVHRELCAIIWLNKILLFFTFYNRDSLSNGIP